MRNITEFKIQSFTTKEGHRIDGIDGISTTPFWANGCKPSQKGWNPTFEEVGQIIHTNFNVCPKEYHILVVGVDDEGYLVGIEIPQP
jgi:hypothetical protein